MRRELDIAAHIAVHIAADRLQLRIASCAGQTEVGADQRRADGAAGRHVHREPRRAGGAPMGIRAHYDMDGRMAAGAGNVDAFDIIVGRAADLHFVPIPAGDLDRTRNVDDLDIAVRIGDAMFLDGPSGAHRRPGQEQRGDCESRESAAACAGGCLSPEAGTRRAIGYASGEC